MLTNINTYDKFCAHVTVSRETYEKLCVFNETLLKWQNSINLISNSSIKNIWERHFLDSAQLYTFVKDVEGNIIDFGSGAGFPGMVMAIMGKKNIHLAKNLINCILNKWRRDGDSNPGEALTPTRFPSVRLRPLGNPP